MEYTSQLQTFPQLFAGLNDSIPEEVPVVTLIACPTYNLITWWKFALRNVNYKSATDFEAAIVLIEQHTEMSRDALYFRYEYPM